MICFIWWSFGWVSYVLKSWTKSQFEGIFGISPSALFSQCLWANLVVSPRPFGCQTRRIPRWGGKGWTDEPHFGTKIKVRIRVDIWLRKFRSISLEKNQKWQDPSFWGVWMATSEEHHIFANDDTMIKRWNWEPIVIQTALILKLLKQFAGWICDRMLRLGPYPPPLIEISDPEENQHLAGRVSGMLWEGFITSLK